MANLPVEIWDFIVQDVVSMHEARHVYTIRDYVVPLQACNLLPRSYLTPLLRVCKAWYPTVEKHLYRSISVGSMFPPFIPDIEAILAFRKMQGSMYTSEQELNRTGFQIAAGLLSTLLSNPRLIGLVKELRLGAGTAIKNIEWTRLNIQILLLCPNVEHVQIHGFHSSERHLLSAVLKRKSLLSFHVIMSESWTGGVNRLIQLPELMQSWPKLRSITVAEPFNAGDRRSGLFPSQMAGTSAHYPELRTVIISGLDLTDSDFKILHDMCPNVTDLEVPLSIEDGESDATLNGLVKCLSSWTSTLVTLKLDILDYAPVYHCFSEALVSFRCLRELEVQNMRLDVDSVADLPHLERLRCISLEGLTECLENQDKFPALTYISVRYLRNEACDKRLEDVCSTRGIELEFRDEHVDTYFGMEHEMF